MAKVAVWIPVYNDAKHLREALDSVLAQNFGDDDYVICVSDNHSNDGSAEIIQEYLDKPFRPRIIVWKPATHLAGIEHMAFCWDRLNVGDHEYSILLGAHDKWASQHLEVLVARMDAERAVRPIAVTYTDTYQMDEAGQIIGRYNDILQTGQIGPAMLPQYVIAGVSSPQFYGMWTEEIRRKIPIRHACAGFDHLIIAEAALHGAILFESATQLVMRAPKEGSTLEDYGQRHLPPEMLEMGPKDFLNQLEWCIHNVDVAIECIPEPARPLYKALLTASMFGTYMSLRGLNLNCVPGAMAAFNKLPEVQSMFSAAQHISESVRMITGSNPGAGNT